MATPNFSVQSSPNPAGYADAVTPSDTVNLAQDARALYVGVGGNITVFLIDNTAVLFANVPAGFILPVRARRVNATGTTASSIVAMY